MFWTNNVSYYFSQDEFCMTFLYCNHPEIPLNHIYLRTLLMVMHLLIIHIGTAICGKIPGFDEERRYIFHKSITKCKLMIFNVYLNNLSEWFIYRYRHLKYIPGDKYMVLLWAYYQFLEVDPCDVFSQILQGCFTCTGAITWLPQCQWSNPQECG